MNNSPDPPGFLGPEPSLGGLPKPLFHIVPVPYEATVSWGKGAARGPGAILEASTQVELYDGLSVPAESGIFTEVPLPVEDLPPDKALDVIHDRVSLALQKGRIPVLLGGEHSITLGAVRAAAAGGRDLGIVQFDAHADLRDSYQGSPYSHACVMRRVVDLELPVFQIGVRSLSKEEDDFRRERRIGRLDARTLWEKGIPDPILPPDFPKSLYITFDVDAFDPSLMPATGTPEPGGLFWFDALDMLDKIIRDRDVIGFDVVELAPVPGLRGADFTAARLVYSVMGFIVRAGHLDPLT